MTNEDGQIAIVVNGEIYNHAELRADLAAKGHRFRSDSDSEVVAHLYEEVGARVPELLRGMFAFALWDARTGTLLLARDRFGEKPLYYGERPDGFVFASELGALLADERTPATLSLPALDAYLALQYVPAPRHDLRGASRSCRPGTRWRCAAASGPALRRYYQPRFAPTLADIGERGGRRGACAPPSRRRCSSRLMSDVPLGAFLSGGVDSSIVVACMARATGAPVKTFSVGFTEGGRRTTTSCRSRAWSPSATAPITTSWSSSPTWWALLPSIVRHHGEPFADTSAVPTRYLCELTRRHVTVALSGDAGDEAFGGYRRYVWAHVADLLRAPAAVRCRGRGRGGAGARCRAARRAGCASTARACATDEAARYLRFVCHFSAAREGATSTRPSCASASPRDATAEAFAARARRPAPRRHGQPPAGSRRRRPTCPTTSSPRSTSPA